MGTSQRFLDKMAWLEENKRTHYWAPTFYEVPTGQHFFWNDKLMLKVTSLTARDAAGESWNMRQDADVTW